MFRFVLKGEEIPFSEDDIRERTNNINVIPYSDIGTKYVTIGQILGSKSACVILYQESEFNGHWVLLMQHHDRIEFFDPYGYAPDEELRYEKFNHNAALSEMLREEKYEVEYNDVKLQSSSSHINTCGRHCVVRYYFSDMPLKQYQEFLRDNSRLTPDFYVTLMTLI